MENISKNIFCFWSHFIIGWNISWWFLDKYYFVQIKYIFDNLKMMMMHDSRHIDTRVCNKNYGEEWKGLFKFQLFYLWNGEIQSRKFKITLYFQFSCTKIFLLIFTLFLYIPCTTPYGDIINLILYNLNNEIISSNYRLTFSLDFRSCHNLSHTI